MSDERLVHLVARIPEHWGKLVRFDSGWDEIALDLDRYLVRLFPNYEIHQMKEKFGRLRFYWAPGEPTPEDEDALTEYKIRMKKAHALVSAAEIKSGMTCELCGSLEGKTGTIEMAWVKTLCPECDEKLKEERKL